MDDVDWFVAATQQMATDQDIEPCIQPYNYPSLRKTHTATSFTIPIDFKDLVANAIQEVASDDAWQNYDAKTYVNQQQNGEAMVNIWN